jgi:4-diphosphocytidyl-2-C-methyl-D-erythritol kinase
MQPVSVFDELAFARTESGVKLTCNNPALPVDSGNLVCRAAAKFFEKTGIQGGVQIHLEKRIPLAAGLGGGSGNAAVTLTALNELFGHPLSASSLTHLAAELGSDVPFFLRDGPALATGRGEHIVPLEPFQALRGAFAVLIHPGFGISTPWAYQSLARFPEALNGRAGRAAMLISLLREPSLEAAAAEFYNSLEAPALEKYPFLVVLQEFLRAHGALGVLMSGSGSTTFALVRGEVAAAELVRDIRARFGNNPWIAMVDLTAPQET